MVARMRSRLVGPALRMARARGVDPAELIEALELPADAETAEEVVLTLAQLEAAHEHVANAIGVVSLGVCMAEALPTGTFGVAEYSCRTAADVGGGLRRLARYIALLNELVEIELVLDGARVRVEQRIPGRPRCVGRHANEFFVTYVVATARALAADPPTPLAIWLAHDDPSALDALRRATGVETVRANMERNAVVFYAEVLTLPLRSGDPTLNRILEQQAEAALEAHGAPSRFLGRVRRTIRDQLSESVPTVSSLAADMGMSARTLQRRLADDGTNLKREIDALRRELAKAYLGNESLGLAEVAFLLGYRDASAFARAFRRWTGQAPAAYRRAR